jgi:hypothetical protein
MKKSFWRLILAVDPFPHLGDASEGPRQPRLALELSDQNGTALTSLPAFPGELYANGMLNSTIGHKGRGKQQ